MDKWSSPKRFTGHLDWILYELPNIKNLEWLKKTRKPAINSGGADRDRTDDLVIANDALSQLSYGPTVPATDERAE